MDTVQYELQNDFTNTEDSTLQKIFSNSEITAIIVIHTRTQTHVSHCDNVCYFDISCVTTRDCK